MRWEARWDGSHRVKGRIEMGLGRQQGQDIVQRREGEGLEQGSRHGAVSWLEVAEE